MVGLEGATTHIPQRGPLSEENERAERARSILRSGAILRPFRTSAIGVPLKVTPDDRLGTRATGGDDEHAGSGRQNTGARAASTHRLLDFKDSSDP